CARVGYNIWTGLNARDNSLDVW
nr:immunoglobulin heavy chain junction region [Macaca mulatta]MOV87719.1 immunoglobulin heavy chain junction region [Macaca mulatta]